MTAADFQPLLDWLRLNPDWVLASIALIAFIESLALAGIVVPGVLLLFLVGAIAGNIETPLISCLTAGFAGAVAGDILSFYIGHIFKHQLRTTWPFSRYPQALASGEQFFAKHGGKSVVIGRFVGPIRPVMPLIAGMLGMSQARFISFNIASAIAWSPFYLLPGYFAGQAVNLALPENFYLYVLGLIATVSLFLFIFRNASLKLQAGSEWYDTIEIRKNNSRLLRKAWVYFTRHHQPPREFPLASLSLFMLCLSVLAMWTLSHISLLWFDTLDLAALNFALQLRSEIVDPVLIIITMLGDERVLYLSFTLAASMLFVLKTPAAALHLVAAGLLTAFVTHALKYGFAIPRPDIGTALTSYAYPSGHTSGATVLFALIASFVAQAAAKHTRWRYYATASVPIVLIGLSRVLLGAHWLSDVVAGFLLGGCICALTRVFYSRYCVRDTFSMPRAYQVYLLFLALWASAAAAYIAMYFQQAEQLYRLTAP